MQQNKQGLRWLEVITNLLDNRFRIPGTDTRFGLDFLIGLIPGIGDIATFGISSALVVTMVRQGASGMVVVKMLWNILVDAVFGAVPILGDIFDLHYRANRRNLELLKEHYGEGEHQGSAWPVVILVLLLLVALFFGVMWLI
ncbi:MAG: DUF4112 domain-containing protein, partial [Bacteroidota bacterium]